jgi:hypothetical protein
MEKTFRRLPGALLLLGLGVVLFAVAAKLALVQRYGTDQPYADQWMAEGMYFLRGPLYYSIDLKQLTADHGEHRPALTRLWVRGLIDANAGQWDCFLELVANLLIYAAFLAVLWKWLSGLFERGWVTLLVLLLLALFSLPAAYENFLWGFQSCFLFMLLTGLLHLAGTLGSSRPGPRWWLAQLAGFAGLFSIAAGAMSAAALIVLAAVELLSGRRKIWAGWTLAANVILLGLGLWLVPAGLAPIGNRFALLGAALVRTGYLLSWPSVGLGWCVLLQAPWVTLLLVWWRSRDRAQASLDARVVALGLWVAGIAFAIAYGRELTPQTIGARYYDVLLLGLLANALAAVLLLRRWPDGRRWLGLAVGLGWLACAGWGLWTYNQPSRLVPMFDQQYQLAVQQRQVVKDFLGSNDAAPLQAFADTSHRLPNFEITVDFLRDPKVRDLLPPTLTTDGRAGPLSRLARHIANGWPLLFGAAVLCLAGGAIQLRWREEKKAAAWYAT